MLGENTKNRRFKSANLSSRSAMLVLDAEESLALDDADSTAICVTQRRGTTMGATGMTDAPVTPTAEPAARSSVAQRMRLHRQRRRDGLKCYIVQVRLSELDELIRLAACRTDVCNLIGNDGFAGVNVHLTLDRLRSALLRSPSTFNRDVLAPV
jgi:hypothetical protein